MEGGGTGFIISRELIALGYLSPPLIPHAARAPKRRVFSSSRYNTPPLRQCHDVIFERRHDPALLAIINRLSPARPIITREVRR